MSHAWEDAVVSKAIKITSTGIALEAWEQGSWCLGTRGGHSEPKESFSVEDVSGEHHQLGTPWCSFQVQILWEELPWKMRLPFRGCHETVDKAS